MANKIKIKRSAVAGKVPLTTDLELSELAVNTNDGRLYTKKNNGTDSIVEIGGPDFGNRNITTTGTSTAASFSPTSSTVPTNGVYLPAANSVATSTNSTERIRFTSDGYVRLASSTAGIQFNGNTAAANALDDYEEGTWTPVVADNASAGNTATGTFNGVFTKVGNLVTLTMSLTNIVTTGMTGGNILYIRGLPFTAASLTGTNFFTGAVATANTTSTPFCASILDNTSYIRLVLNQSTNQSIYYNTVSDFTSGSADIYCTITYQAA